MWLHFKNSQIVLENRDPGNNDSLMTFHAAMMARSWGQPYQLINLHKKILKRINHMH